MTQLVELQKHLKEFEAEGIELFGISYNTQEELKGFAGDHGITFPLLSDVDSKVIKQLGVLNTLIDPNEPMAKRFYGIPFPGVFVVDESGVITEKMFNRHYATRHSAGTILNSALGRILLPKEAPQTDYKDDHVKITAFLADENLKLEVRSTLYCRIELAEGLHVYGAPVPEGFIATQVEVKETPGVRIGEVAYPPTTPLEFEALGVTLNVFEGVVDIAVPITANAEFLNWTIPHTQKSVTVELSVRYQACNDTVCFVPKTVPISIELPLAELIPPKGM